MTCKVFTTPFKSDIELRLGGIICKGGKGLEIFLFASDATPSILISTVPGNRVFCILSGCFNWRQDGYSTGEAKSAS